jgi:hypothetical protein
MPCIGISWFWDNYVENPQCPTPLSQVMETFDVTEVRCYIAVHKRTPHLWKTGVAGDDSYDKRLVLLRKAILRL